MLRTAVLLICLALLAIPACGGGSVHSLASNASGSMDDIVITAQVKTTLLNDQQISATKIDVTTTAGVVTVSGIVKSEAEAARVVELAKQVAGVREVKSTLQVTP